ncbi:MAG: shikimate dehydrogenase [Chloroflexi bacterium]|nr:shikimate dehydrogenase [Chloroflexota bacterium]
MTRQIGIIGHPLKHSISPAFQQAALDFYKLDIAYKVWDVERVEWAVEQLRQPETLGANVTVPYKESIIPFLDGLAPQAWEIGAVNTVVKEGEGKGLSADCINVSIISKDKSPHRRLCGYNTDASGFMRALREEAAFEPRGKIVALLGAGGVARAVGFALVHAGVNSLIVFNRTAQRSRQLVEALHSKVRGKQTISARSWRQDVMRRALPQVDLIVNCTTLGMKHGPGVGKSPISAELIPAGAMVYDLVYNPPVTPLIREAQKAGARALGGLSMLVYQGADAFELWTGRKAPLDIMFEAARKALE